MKLSKPQIVISMLLICFALFPLGDRPLVFTMVVQWMNNLSSIASVSSSHLFYGVLLSIYCWSTFLFILWLAVLAPIYWGKIAGELKRLKQSESTRIELIPRVTVIVPAYNEEKTIIQTINACLRQSWLASRIVIVDDGSEDMTSELVISEFNLGRDFEAENFYRTKDKKLEHAGIFVSIYSNDHIFLLKTSNAGKGYAMNAGVEMSDSEFVCVFDADTIPDYDGIRHLVTPMILDQSVVLTSGRNQFVNGCRVEDGRVTDFGLTKNPLLISQSVEFFNDVAIKAFRNSINAQTVLIGNFSAYRTSIIFELNGFANRGVTEDYDFNMEVLRQRLNGRNIHVLSILNVRGWTQAPYSLSGFFSQRTRWSAGVLDTMIRQKNLLFNKMSGALGMFIMPLQWYKVLTLPISSFMNFIVLPVVVWMWFTDPSVNSIFNDVILYYCIPAYLYEYVLEVIIMIYLDLKYVKSYERKMSYVWILVSKMLGGYFYDAYKSYCTIYGYAMTLNGTAIWGRSERTKM